MSVTASSDHQFVLRALPHPAMRRTAAYLATILAAGESGIVCTLDTSLDFVTAADEIAIYVRPAATDALALTTTADLAEPPRLRDACASMAEFDERCAGLPTLSWESLVADPHDALRVLARQLPWPLREEAHQAASAHIAALRSDVASFGHPISFIAATESTDPEAAWTDNGLYAGEGSFDVTPLLDPTIPRTLLILARADSDAGRGPIEDPAGWQISYATIDNGVIVPNDLPAGHGVIYLHHVDAALDASPLLDRLMESLAKGGVLCGEELSEAAVETVVAKLTAAGERHGLIFMLSGPNWLAHLPAWCR